MLAITFRPDNVVVALGRADPVQHGGQKEKRAVLHGAQNESPTTTDTKFEFVVGVVQWLDDLLDMARERQDAPLARLIADLMDDLATGTAMC